MNYYICLRFLLVAKKHFSMPMLIISLITTLASSSASASFPQFCAVDWYGNFSNIDPQLGKVSPLRTDLPSSLQELAWSPNGTLYAGRNGDIYTIDPSTGDYSHFLSITSDIRGMTFSPDDKLYVTAGDWQHPSLSQHLRVIDVATGNYSNIGDLWGSYNSAQGLAFSPNGKLYGITPADPSKGGYALFTIDLDDAEVHIVNQSFTANVNQAITFTLDGSLYALGTTQFAQLDQTTGTVMGSVLTFSGDYRGLAIVPEPSTLILLAMSAIGLFTFALRRRK
jgi:WD40 repeat protein